MVLSLEFNYQNRLRATTTTTTTHTHTQNTLQITIHDDDAPQCLFDDLHFTNTMAITITATKTPPITTPIIHTGNESSSLEEPGDGVGDGVGVGL